MRYWENRAKVGVLGVRVQEGGGSILRGRGQNSTLVGLQQYRIADKFACIKTYSLMFNQLNPKIDSNQSWCYQIRLRGHLGSQWKEWLGGLDITLEENGDTLLTGPVADQAALHGLLKKIRDLGMPLLSVICIEPGPAAASDV